MIEVIDLTVIGSSVVTIIILAIFGSIMKSRTKYGCEILGKIRGFRRFLVNARKDELEQLVLQTPNYFYDILPYTYVLGISNKWISKFEEINIEPPTWYCGTQTTFNIFTFSKSLNRAFAYTNNVMSSSPSSSSGGGGSSGGGHSGGGAGGGGGSSW